MCVSFLSANAARSFGKTRQDLIHGLEQDYGDLFGCDVVKVSRQHVLGQIGHGACHLYACRACADQDECQKAPAFLLRLRSFGELEREENLTANRDRLFQRL
jgi:hypothetical protein